MSKRILLALLVFAAVAMPQVQTTSTTIDAGKTGAPISKYLYGQFIEHIGGIINTGIWAEMLEDRKFYSPVSSRAPAPAPGRGGRGPARRWTPIGPDDAVVMDAKRPYAGDQAVLVKLNGAEARGIQQSGLTVRKGKGYSGRVVLAGDAAAKVAVSLVWGTNPSERQTVAVGRLGAAYAKFPLSFQAAADSDNARLEIAGTGAGTFLIGATSLMPANNDHGFRPEVIAALKQLRSGVYRFPGGNFVSAHEWRDAIGDPDKRPPKLDPAWHAVQPNDVGTDEFMTMCRLLEVEPYITVNAGFGDAHSAADYVEYTNGAATTPMGHEMWGDWSYGVMPLAQFELKHNLFAAAMRRVDPTIKLIASGASPDAMTGSKQSKRISGKIVPDYLSDADWSGGLLAHCLENLDMVSEHYSSYSNQRFDIEKGDRVPTGPDWPLIEWERAPATQVRVKYEHYQEYLARIPALKDKRVGISLDEWAYNGAPPERVQGGARLCLGVPRDVPALGPLPTGGFYLRHLSVERQSHRRGVESGRPPVQALPRSFRHHPRRGVWQFTAARAQISRGRRPAESESGERHLSAGRGCGAQQRPQDAYGGGNQSDRDRAATANLFPRHGALGQRESVAHGAREHRCQHRGGAEARSGSTGTGAGRAAGHHAGGSHQREHLRVPGEVANRRRAFLLAHRRELAVGHAAPQPLHGAKTILLHHQLLNTTWAP
jgi:alpha-N-arabinofuranosidase